jgi:hypothetical protein
VFAQGRSELQGKVEMGHQQDEPNSKSGLLLGISSQCLGARVCPAPDARETALQLGSAFATE